jgi:hypothetical protein
LQSREEIFGQTEELYHADVSPDREDDFLRFFLQNFDHSARVWGIISPPFKPWETFVNPGRRNHIFEKIRSGLPWQTRL